MYSKLKRVELPLRLIYEASLIVVELINGCLTKNRRAMSMRHYKCPSTQLQEI